MMDRLTIEAGKQAPEVVLDLNASEFRVFGKSFPENAEKFYTPLYDWFESLASNGKPSGPHELQFKLEYINSSSIFSILELIHRVRDVNKAGFQFSVVWQYDEGDEDIRRIGEDYARLTEVEFRLVVIEED